MILETAFERVVDILKTKMPLRGLLLYARNNATR